MSTQLLGFSRLEQVDENLKCLELYHKWNREIEEKVENAVKFAPVPSHTHSMNYKTFQMIQSRREVAVFGQK